MREVAFFKLTKDGMHQIREPLTKVYTFTVLGLLIGIGIGYFWRMTQGF
jgi:hypothetical protein